MMLNTEKIGIRELTDAEINEVSGGFNKWSAAGGAVVGGLQGWRETRGERLSVRVGYTAGYAAGGAAIGASS